MFWLFGSAYLALGEPIFWDDADENWFHRIENIDDQIVFTGRIVEDGEAYVWAYSWDQEWSVIAETPSDMQSMATNEAHIAICGFTSTSEGPKSWIWILDTQGRPLKDIILWEEGVSDCSSIIPYQDGFLASVVLREPDRKRSTLLSISLDGQVESLIDPIDDIEIMGIVSREEQGLEQIAAAGFSLHPEQTLGWIGVFAQGVLSWQHERGEGMFNKLKNLNIDEEGKLLSCGYTTPQDPENWDIWLLKWDWEGNILFETIWGGELMDGCKNLKPAPNGYVFIGDSQSYEADGWDVLRGELDQAGGVVSWEIFGEEGDDYGYDFLQAGSRLFWVGALIRDEDGKRVAWVDLEELPEAEALDTGIDAAKPNTCGCREAESGLLLLPLVGLLFGWIRRH